MVEPRRLNVFPSPLRRRPTKPQIAALVLVTVLSLGPLVALITTLSRNTGPVATLVTGATPPRTGAHLVETITSVTPATGLMTASLQLEPAGGLLDANGLARELVMRVNDIRGDNEIRFPAGQPLRPVTVNLPLTGSSLSRYPFDRYRSAILVRLETGADATGETTPVELVRFTVDVQSQVSDFTVRVDPFADGRTHAAPAVGVGVRLARPTTTTVYAVGVMVLMWGLAIAGIALLWTVTVRGVEVPAWSIGYLVGVLFALMPLRTSLPGSPPPGTILDFVGFYWCIGLVGLTLILLLAVWIQRSRATEMG